MNRDFRISMSPTPPDEGEQNQPVDSAIVAAARAEELAEFELARKVAATSSSTSPLSEWAESNLSESD
jgi:hypothetical protein